MTHYCKSVFIALIFTVLCGHSFAAPRAMMVIYPLPENPGDQRGNFPLSLLRLALGKTSLQYQLRPATSHMQQGRSMAELQANSGRLSVLWTMTSREREDKLLPIRIPIDKGLFGWRVAIIRTDHFDLFKGVVNPKQLSAFVAGQGHDWPDTDILKAAGLPVETTYQYENLFLMLSSGRFDYFPRSILEMMPEVESHRELGLMIEPSIVIHYPVAIYFFVNKNNQTLHNAIETGLERAIKDGSFNKLFYKTYGADIERARLADRRIIQINNALLPPETPLNRSELWFRPTAPSPVKRP